MKRNINTALGNLKVSGDCLPMIMLLCPKNNFSDDSNRFNQLPREYILNMSALQSDVLL